MSWVPWAVAAGAGVGVLAWAGEAMARSGWPEGGGIGDRRQHARLSADAAEHTRARRESDVLFLRDKGGKNDENSQEGSSPFRMGGEDLETHKMNVALASLAGFYMDDNGFVTHVDEPRSIPNLSPGRHPNSR